MDPNGISGLELTEKLDNPSTLSRVLKVSSRVTPEMALRLSVALGRSLESWLAMQDAYDLWVAQGRGFETDESRSVCLFNRGLVRFSYGSRSP
ncbi:HigA family addiction module antitoxin [Pseudomonas sp. NA13]